MKQKRAARKRARRTGAAAVSAKQQGTPARAAWKENREHKSSVFADLFYEDETAEKNLLSLYNALHGTNYRMHLSDSFLNPTAANPLELTVKIININSNKGHDILKKCRVLREYSLFVDTVRKYEKEEDSLKKAINECIANGILADYLKRKGSEVTNMLIAEYDYEEDIRANREEAREEAIEEVWDAAKKEVEAAKKEAETAKEDAVRAAKEEIEKYSRLILRLTGEGKTDMIIRIAADNALRERLYREYHL